MKNKTFLALLVIFPYLMGCSTATDPGAATPPPHAGAFYEIDDPIQCVPYARDVSGIEIYGDAYTWWNQSRYAYKRGHKPKAGSVLVLSKAGKLKYGHLAVVNKVIDEDTIEVTHSNWGNNRDRRSVIYNAMKVQDISPQGDWSRVRFWNYELASWGLPYKVSGFIYQNDPEELGNIVTAAGQ